MLYFSEIPAHSLSVHATDFQRDLNQSIVQACQQQSLRCSGGSSSPGVTCVLSCCHFGRQNKTWTKLCCKLLEVFFPSTLIKIRVPDALQHADTIMLPPSCFIVWMRCSPLLSSSKHKQRLHGQDYGQSGLKVFKESKTLSFTGWAVCILLFFEVQFWIVTSWWQQRAVSCSPSTSKRRKTGFASLCVHMN